MQILLLWAFMFFCQMGVRFMIYGGFVLRSGYRVNILYRSFGMKR